MQVTFRLKPKDEKKPVLGEEGGWLLQAKETARGKALMPAEGGSGLGQPGDQGDRAE